MSYGKPKNMMGGFVLILKSAWGVLSTLYFWAWGVLSAFKKTCGGFCPPIRKWAWGVLSVGCFVLHSTSTVVDCFNPLFIVTLLQWQMLIITQ